MVEVQDGALEASSGEVVGVHPYVQAAVVAPDHAVAVVGVNLQDESQLRVAVARVRGLDQRRLSEQAVQRLLIVDRVVLRQRQLAVGSQRDDGEAGDCPTNCV
ncbi:MAG TPA: hypothetical protein VNT54_12420 [Solirubrobacteraceae bacterium]|nr:hypothetical protein [Solirubrobacteraceae bacterium]